MGGGIVLRVDEGLITTVDSPCECLRVVPDGYVHSEAAPAHTMTLEAVKEEESLSSSPASADEWSTETRQSSSSVSSSDSTNSTAEEVVVATTWPHKKLAMPEVAVTTGSRRLTHTGANDEKLAVPVAAGKMSPVEGKGIETQQASRFQGNFPNSKKGGCCGRQNRSLWDQRDSLVQRSRCATRACPMMRMMQPANA